MQVSFEERKAAARVFGTNDTTITRFVAAVLGSSSPTKGLSAETEVSFEERNSPTLFGIFVADLVHELRTKFPHAVIHLGHSPPNPHTL